MDGEFFPQIIHIGPETLVCLRQIVHGAHRMKYRCVVFVPALRTNGGQRALGQLFGKEHGQLTRLYDLPLSGLALEQFHRHIEVVADDLLDVVDGDLPSGVLDELIDHLTGQIAGDLLFIQRSLGQ